MSEDKRRGNRELAADFSRALAQLDDGERARLKRNAGRTLAESRHVQFLFYGKLLPRGAGRWNEERFFLLATLYPFDKGQRRRDNEARMGKESSPARARSLGESLRKMRTKDNERGLDTSVARLLDATESSLSYHLRRAVMRLSNEGKSIDWQRLTADVLNWTHPDRYVQRHWARDYVAHSPAEENQGEPVAQQS